MAQKCTFRNPVVALSESRQEWNVIRECYVKSFLDYSLYKYIEPDLVLREKFLRAYLDANYDVTVGSGQGIMVALRVQVEKTCKCRCTSCSGKSYVRKTIGGAILMPPSCDGYGWAMGNDDPYWKAYEKHGLENISKEGLQRVKRYEAWEHKHIAEKAFATRIPLWNGLFCALEPEFSCQGLGSSVYQKGVHIMAKHWYKNFDNVVSTNSNSTTFTKPHQQLSLKNYVNSLSSTNYRALLQQKAMAPNAVIDKSIECDAKIKGISKMAPQHKSAKAKIPLVVVISHSDRSARFHKSNGFQSVIRTPFYDEVEDKTPFFTHLLILDTFDSGRVEEFKNNLQEKKSVGDLIDSDAGMVPFCQV